MIASAVFLLALACAGSRPSIPYCDDSVQEAPLPSAECLGDPDTREFLSGLSGLISESAGQLLFRVQFDQAALVASVCAQRAAVAHPWRARAAAHERLPELLAAGPGPACLAGRRLDFNRSAARGAEIQKLVEQCFEEATPGFESPAPPELAEAHLRARTNRCEERLQIQRREIWLFGRAGPPEVFERTRGSIDRRTALLSCADDASPISRLATDAHITRVWRDSTFEECLKDHGWELVK